MGAVHALYARLKPLLPAGVQQRVTDLYTVLSVLRPHRFEWIVYQAAAVPEPDLTDLEIEPVPLTSPLTPEQRAFIRRDLSEPALRTLLRTFGDVWECVYLSRTEGRYCSYMFCRSPQPLRRAIPELNQPRACIIGPGYTAPEFRGRNIHARAMQFAIRDAQRRGYGPFFGFVYPWNKAAISAMAKAGWQRLGLWRGVSAFGGRWVRARRVAD